MGSGKGEIWTLAEIRDGKLHPVSWELLAWGRNVADALGVPLASVVLGDDMPDTTPLFERGADKVYLASDPSLKHHHVDATVGVLMDMVGEYDQQVFIAS